MKTALVLAGGGSKGAYQAGCIKALKELGYTFDIVTGTSIGALNGLLVVQEDYDALYRLWDEITISDVLEDPVNFDFSIDSMIMQTELIKPFLKSFINEKGADITPLKNILYALYNEQKALNSKIDYGLVTVKYPKLTPVEITKGQMMPTPIIEYAIASASCFPAFPVHHINDQGYIDGGYYDNLPISLALKMKADNIIAIELNQEITHDYFLNRPNITIIRPSYDLGNFLDFNRELLNWRIQLGYYDTMKQFNKFKGYRYIFTNFEINQTLANKFYRLILNYEDTLNKNIVSKTITSSSTPLTDLLKSNTYLNTLTISDYFIRAIEIAMDHYNYQSDLIYDFNKVCKEIIEIFKNDYQNNCEISQNRFVNIPIKEIFTKIKKLSSLEVICIFYHSLINQEIIETSLINNIFHEEYLIALLLYTLI